LTWEPPAVLSGITHWLLYLGSDTAAPIQVPVLQRSFANPPTAATAWISSWNANRKMESARIQLGSGSLAGKVAAVPPTQVTQSSIVIQIVGTQTVNGKQQVQIQVSYATLPDPASYVEVFMSPGATPPTDASQMTLVGQAPNGSPVLFWIDRPPIDTYYYFTLAASTAVWHTTGSTLLPGAPFLVTARALAFQVTGFSATYQAINAGGVPSYRVVFQFSVALVNPDYAYTLIEQILCDNTYTPLVGQVWTDIAHMQTSGSFNLNYQPNPATTQYVQYRASAVNENGDVNTILRPTANVNIPASTGIDMSKLNPVTISNEFVVDPGTGELTMAVIDLAKAAGFDINDFAIAAGTFKVNAIAVNKLLAGTALFLGTVVFARQSGASIQIDNGITISWTGSSITATFNAGALNISDGAGNYSTVLNGAVQVAQGTNIVNIGGGYGVSVTGRDVATDQNVTCAQVLPTSPVDIAHGGTGSATLAAAQAALGIPALPVSVANGGTGATTAATARSNLSAAQKAAADMTITLTLAKITAGGTNGAIQFNADGVLIGFLAPT